MLDDPEALRVFSDAELLLILALLLSSADTDITALSDVIVSEVRAEMDRRAVRPRRIALEILSRASDLVRAHVIVQRVGE